ncbi:cytochrome P450 [Nonomuraea terrae]|nr:cytochrome P450 [Nonomuraea terrae]
MTVQLPLEQVHPLAVPPALRDLQSRGVIHPVRTRVGHPAWLVTGYEEIRALIADPRLGRAHREPDKASRLGDWMLFSGPMGDFDTEHDDEARVRAQLQPHFAPGRMRALRPRVEALTTDLLDELERHGSPADLQEALAGPLPVLVICELLGVPYEDRDEFSKLSRAAGDILDPARSEQGLMELYEYGKRLVERKRDEAADDVISRMLQSGDLSDDEIAMHTMMLLFAGHETTVSQIGLGAACLLADPGQWRALHDDPSLVPSAVEEILRAPSLGGPGIPRYAREDLTVGEVTVRAGDLVILDIGAGNHDGAVFADPDRFDASRKDSPHLTFGFGARYCIGAQLARIELQAVFADLTRRFPDMRLAVPVEKLQRSPHSSTGVLLSLPVEW